MKLISIFLVSLVAGLKSAAPNTVAQVSSASNPIAIDVSDSVEEVEEEMAEDETESVDDMDSADPMSGMGSEMMRRNVRRSVYPARPGNQRRNEFFKMKSKDTHLEYDTNEKFFDATRSSDDEPSYSE